MPLFNIFFKRKEKVNTDKSIAKEFIDSRCECKQQELDLSELTWMDLSNYKNSKEKIKSLKPFTKLDVITYLEFDRQGDLFRGKGVGVN